MANSSGWDSTFSASPDHLLQPLVPLYLGKHRSGVRVQGQTGGTEINLQKNL